MIPHAGDPYFLPRVLPFHRLNEIALLSEPVMSETLAEWGVVNRCVPADQALASRVASAIAVASTWSAGTAFEEERTAQALISTTHDRREGMQAFVERRAAEFTGD